MCFRPSLLLSLCPQESQVFALLVSQSAATRPQWLATSRRSRPSTRLLPTAASGSCPGSSRPTYGESIQTQMPGALTLCILFVVSPSFSPHFLPASKHFPFQNSLSTKLLFHLLSPAEGMHCIFLGWLSLSETPEKGPASFCKVFISLMQNASQIRRLADNLSTNSTLDSCPPSQAEDQRGLPHWPTPHPQDPQDGQVTSEEQEEGEHLPEHDDGGPRQDGAPFSL